MLRYIEKHRVVKVWLRIWQNVLGGVCLRVFPVSLFSSTYLCILILAFLNFNKGIEFGSDFRLPFGEIVLKGSLPLRWVCPLHWLLRDSKIQSTSRVGCHEWDSAVPQQWIITVFWVTFDNLLSYRPTFSYCVCVEYYRFQNPTYLSLDLYHNSTIRPTNMP